MNTSLFRASAMLFGTIIGAGVLGVPYVVAKSGFLTGLLTIVVLGVAMLILNLFFSEVILRTPGNHQIPGYAEKYLGRWGKRIMLFAMLFGVYGALVAYLIGEGEALSAIFGFSPLAFSLVFFVISAILVYIGLKAISRSEMIFSSVVIALVLIISGVAIFSSGFDVSNLSNFNIANVMIPYGVVLFAFLGTAAIPEMKEVLVKDKKNLKKAILIGSLIPLVLYVLFALACVGVTGLNTSEVATVGLGEVLGQSVVIFGNLFAIFAMFTSFLTLALAMKEIYMYDYNMNPIHSWLLTMFIPLVIFLLGAKSFVGVIDITGAFSGGLTGIILVLMFWRAGKLNQRHPEFMLDKRFLLGLLLILIFMIGILNQILELI